MIFQVRNEYAIRIEDIGADHFAWLLDRNYAGWVVLTDEHTHEKCLPLLRPLPEGTAVHVIRVPAGERHKHLDTCRYIWEEMFRAGAGRRWCCLNLGGGVIGDMGGFAAATFKRGMDFIQIPTTLLSQVDASVGGKTGIDFYGVKNSIGVFQNPVAVWIDPRFLRTLPNRELRSGYAEVIKHALIADAAAWDTLRAQVGVSALDWGTIIAESVDIKRKIVLEDPLERGARKALNFGHTVGHAVESWFMDGEQPLLHGEAIAVGMICESWISAQLGRLSAEHLAQVSEYLLGVYGKQRISPASFDRLVELMGQDKKNDGVEINFTLLDAPGRHRVNQTATPGMIRESLQFYNRL